MKKSYSLAISMMKIIFVTLLILIVLFVGMLHIFRPSILAESFEFQASGDWIVFSCSVYSPNHPVGEIHIIRSDGSEAHQISNENFVVGGGDWSPDGSRISFFDNSNLYILSLATWELSQVIPLRNRIYGADWNPDNNTIAIASSKSLILFDTENQSQEIILRMNGYVESVRWDASGTLIAFVVRQGGTESGIYIFDTTTNLARFVFPHERGIGSLVWSPDGNELYLALNINNNTPAAPYSLNINSGELSPLPIENYADDPDLSPLGEWIAFVGSGEDNPTQMPQIYKSHLSGDELQRLTSVPDCYVSNPRWFSFENK